MSLHRRAARRDQSEDVIVLALIRLGYSVLRISTKDAPDLLVGKGGRSALIECKTGKNQLRPGQQQFADQWRGEAVAVVRTVEDVIAWDQQRAGR